MLLEYDFTEERVRSALDRIENARKEQEKTRRQRSLDGWF